MAGFSQKYDHESFAYNFIHLPLLLIYDQVKTTGVNVVIAESRQYNADLNMAKQLFPPMRSYKEVNYPAADLKIDV